MAHFGGLLGNEAYEHEQALIRDLMLKGIAEGKTHFERYIEEWERLQKLIAKR